MADPTHHDHQHSHGMADPDLLRSVSTSQRGIRAVKWSLVGLGMTALVQLVIVVFSGSVALFADTVHNFGDAATAIPLWIAFALVRRRPGRRFTYGYGRVEDLAGIVVVLFILASALIAAYSSVDRLFNPREVSLPWFVMGAGIIGFLGNEAVALLRIKVGKEIGSAALEADGYHARVDGLTSLAVVFSALGILLGFPLLDPIVGLLISVMILRLLWSAAKPVLTRLLDGVDAELIEEIRHVAGDTARILQVADVRARWIGHELHTELNVAVDSALTVDEGHRIADEVHHELLHHVPHLTRAVIHVDPEHSPGESFHVPHHRSGESGSHAH